MVSKAKRLHGEGAAHYEPRIAERHAPTLRILPGVATDGFEEPIKTNVAIDCGWGRLIFGHTFASPEDVAAEVLRESKGRRDIAFYLKDPHVVLSLAPQQLFLDPSHTYRLSLTSYLPGRVVPRGFRVRRLQRRSDTAAINRILKRCGMLPADPDFMWKQRASKVLTYLVAEEPVSGEILGTVMGVDHAHAFNDPENGASLWCLAVDAQAPVPGVGRALTAYLADHYHVRGRTYLDLSVMHDNTDAIRLYEDMNFRRVPVFCVKRKNPINEKLYTGPEIEVGLNPYAQIIVDAARRRGIMVEDLDEERGYFTLRFGGRAISCWESLSDLTSAVAMTRCADKRMTRKILADDGFCVPAQRAAGNDEENREFLEDHKRIVVKPNGSEQGHGIRLNVQTMEELRDAVEYASRFDETVLLEEQVEGQDLRIVVIDFQVVAAALRRPPEVTGNGRDTVETLIKKQSRRRQAATGGESRIPIDAATEACVVKQGRHLGDVLPAGETLHVREAANLHTGGTIHDVTAELGDRLRKAAEEAARLLNLPVVGLDFMVKDPTDNEYFIIEANERPGLANHEPQPTAERFIDLLFPQTRREPI